MCDLNFEKSENVYCSGVESSHYDLKEILNAFRGSMLQALEKYSKHNLPGTTNPSEESELAKNILIALGFNPDIKYSDIYQQIESIGQKDHAYYVQQPSNHTEYTWIQGGGNTPSIPENQSHGSCQCCTLMSLIHFVYSASKNPRKSEMIPALTEFAVLSAVKYPLSNPENQVNILQALMNISEDDLIQCE